MSRCFPFPPPGYEKKVKADDPSLLKKENRKEKNPKKEKKESREKREKERTDEKRREKKDKKEKHRDSNKDKHKGDSLFADEKRTATPTPDGHLKFHEKSRNRENNGNFTLGENRVAGPPVFNNGESVSKNNHLASQPVGKNNHLVSQTKIFKNSTGTGRRNTDEENRIGNQLLNEKVSAERQKGVVKISGTSAVPTIDAKAKTNEKPVVEKMDVLGFVGKSKFSGNALGQSVVGPVKFPGRSPGPLVDGRERKDKHATDGRMGGLAVSGEARSSTSSLPPNFVGTSQSRVGAMVKPVEKKLEQKLEERSKIVREEGEYKKGEKRKEIREKPIHQDKEKKKEEKVAVAMTSELKKPVQVPSKIDGSENHMLIPSFKNEIKKDISVAHSDGLQSTPKPSTHGVTTLLGKRKDIALNGTYDEHVTGPNKLAKTTVSTPTLTKNGRSMDLCQNSAAFAVRPPMNIKAERTFAPDETQRSPMNIKMDGKEQRKINDTNLEPPVKQTSQTTSKAERKPKVHAKPPHPDTKYLSQVLAVPKLEEWPEIDDQEWLCSSNVSQTKMSQLETSGVDEEPMVWAKALWLEPADVFALPYVIPH